MGKQTIYRNLHFSSLHLTCFSFQLLFSFLFASLLLTLVELRIFLLCCYAILVVMVWKLESWIYFFMCFCFNLKVFQAYLSYIMMKIYCNHRYINLHHLESWEFLSQLSSTTCYDDDLLTIRMWRSCEFVKQVRSERKVFRFYGMRCTSRVECSTYASSEET